METCLIVQSAGLGDIFFCQKIAETLIHNDYKVIWPVKTSILWVGEYLINSSPIEYIDEKETRLITQTQDILKITLDGAQVVTGNLIMPSKYQILGLEWENWVDFFNFERNTKKENELYYSVLGLKDNESYTFTNKYYGTPPHHLTYDVETNPEEKTIDLEMLEGFTIFDWCKVIENASKISIVDTCLNYIIEKIDIKTNDLTCYCRHGELTYNQISPLFKKTWKYKWN